MSVIIWWGERPKENYEQAAVKELADKLAKLPERFYLFANFYVGTDKRTEQIDVAVFTSTSAYIIELKSSAGYPVYGNINGRWRRADNTPFGERNPVRQVADQYAAFRKWLFENRGTFLANNKAAVSSKPESWNDIRKFIVLYPIKHPDSEIDVSKHQAFHGHLGDAIGFNTLADHLTNPTWRGKLPVKMSEEEIVRLANNLALEEVSIKNFDVKKAAVHKDANPVTPKVRKAIKHVSATRKRWLVAAIAIPIVVFILFFVVKNPPEPSWTIDSMDAWAYLGKTQTVRMQLNRISNSYTDKSVLLFDQRMESSDPHNFSIEIKGDIDAITKELESMGFQPGVWFVVGPSVITTASSKKPQIELQDQELHSKIHLLKDKE
jgi:hypothetical protein